jgi:hypothetical protein
MQERVEGTRQRAFMFMTSTWQKAEGRRQTGDESEDRRQTGDESEDRRQKAPELIRGGFYVY